MNIFLAGKMNVNDGAWRTAIVGQRHWNVLRRGGTLQPAWYNLMDTQDREGQVDRSALVQPWGTLKRAILGIHDYAGPYRQMYWYDMTGGHGGDLTELPADYCTHGVGCQCWESDGTHLTDIDEAKGAIINNCTIAIQCSDMVFAVINEANCYGTITELSFARWLGKYIAVMVHPSIDRSDLWYPLDMADYIAPWPEQYVKVGDSSHWTPSHVQQIAPDGRAALEGLRDALVHYTAWKPPMRSTAVLSVSTAAAEAARSFRQIAQWTSDPRVRNEAERMLGQLRG